MESSIGLILGIIAYLIRSSIETLLNVLKFIGELMYSLGFVSGFGLVPFLMAAAILGIVLICVWKFFVGSLKTMMLLFIGGMIILGIVFLLG